MGYQANIKGRLFPIFILSPRKNICSSSPSRRRESNSIKFLKPQSPLTVKTQLAADVRSEEKKINICCKCLVCCSTLANTSFSTAVFTKAFAVFVGYCVVIGSCVRSVPQIIRVIRNKSAAGLSLTSVISEYIAYVIIIAYNINKGYAFSTFGDILSCFIQDIVLICVIFFYNKIHWTKSFSCILLLTGYLLLLTSGYVSTELLTFLQGSTIFIMGVGGKIPQIKLNMERGDSGELSLITCALNVAGCIARIFTTMILTGDWLNLWGSITQGLLNGILLFQTIATHRKQRAALATKQ